MMFWDASAILPLCVEEHASEEMKSYLIKDPFIIVWWGTLIECYSAFSRLQRDGILSHEELQGIKKLLYELASSWNEIIPVQEVKDQAIRLISVHPIKAADSLQLAAAHIWAGKKPKDNTVVCLDKTLHTAMQKEGFNVLPENIQVY